MPAPESSVEEAPRLPAFVKEWTRTSGQVISEKAEQIGAAARAGTRILAERAGRAADSALDELSTYHEDKESHIIPRKVLSRITTALPILGPTKSYADARAKYLEGREKQDDALISQARRECLYACVELGIDISFLPIAAGAKGIGLLAKLKAIATTTAEFALIKQMRHFNKSLGLKLHERAANGILKSPIAQASVDYMLQFAADAAEKQESKAA